MCHRVFLLCQKISVFFLFSNSMLNRSMPSSRIQPCGHCLGTFLCTDHHSVRTYLTCCKNTSMCVANMQQTFRALLGTPAQTASSIWCDELIGYESVDWMMVCKKETWSSMIYFLVLHLKHFIPFVEISCATHIPPTFPGLVAWSLEMPKWL